MPNPTEVLNLIDDPKIMEQNLQALTKFERFEKSSESDKNVEYRCFTHGLEYNDQHIQFSHASLGQLGTTYVNKSVLLNHWDDAFGWGKTVNGEMEKDGLYVKIFIIPDLTLLGVDSNSVIKALDQGGIDYVSMGITIKDSVCSICGKQFRSECEHWRGQKYRLERDGVIVEETCIEMVQESVARELSLVYLGADKQARVVAKLSAYQSESKDNFSASRELLSKENLPLYKRESQIVTNVNNFNLEKEINMPGMEVYEAEINMLKAQIESKDAMLSERDEKVNSAVAEKKLSEKMLEQQIETNKELKADVAKLETYKSDSEFLRKRLLDEFGVAFVGYNDKATEKDKDNAVRLADNLSTEELCNRIETYRGLIIDKSGAGEGRQSLTDDITDNPTETDDDDDIVIGHF